MAEMPNVLGINVQSNQAVEANNPPASNAPDSKPVDGTTFVSNNPMSSFYMPDGGLLVFGADGKYTTTDAEEIEELSKACLSSHGAIHKL